MREARDDAGADRVPRVRHDNGDSAGRLTCSYPGGECLRNDDLDIACGKLPGEFDQPLLVSVGVAFVDHDALAFDISKISQPLPEQGMQCCRKKEPEEPKNSTPM